jgi:hypothetical protein
MLNMRKDSATVTQLGLFNFQDTNFFRDYFGYDLVEGEESYEGEPGINVLTLFMNAGIIFDSDAVKWVVDKVRNYPALYMHGIDMTVYYTDEEYHLSGRVVVLKRKSDTTNQFEEFEELCYLHGIDYERTHVGVGEVPALFIK